MGPGMGPGMAPEAGSSRWQVAWLGLQAPELWLKPTTSEGQCDMPSSGLVAGAGNDALLGMEGTGTQGHPVIEKVPSAGCSGLKGTGRAEVRFS